MKTEKPENKRSFTVENENGRRYTFDMEPGTTNAEALAYANVWNAMAGEARVTKAWETP